MINNDKDERKQEAGWLIVVSFFAYFGFFIFLLAKYGRSDDPSWIR